MPFFGMFGNMMAALWIERGNTSGKRDEILAAIEKR
jgi:lysophosphatidylcholine acyltransferase/lyso-PAF acetyltransferase